MPPTNIKPENVLKRAQELIAVNQSGSALALLHEHVVAKRSRNNPIASMEPVLTQFVELAVDLRKGKFAKDGLYSYKVSRLECLNISATTNSHQEHGSKYKRWYYRART